MSIKDTARKIPGVAAVEGAFTGALATEQDLPIAAYDKQGAADIASKLKGFSQRELRMIDAYERQNQNRATITDKIAKLSGDEPFSGYDELNVDAIAKALDDADTDTAKNVKSYEGARKARSGVIDAAEKRMDRSWLVDLPDRRREALGRAHGSHAPPGGQARRRARNLGGMSDRGLGGPTRPEAGPAPHRIA